MLLCWTTLIIPTSSVQAATALPPIIYLLSRSAPATPELGFVEPATEYPSGTDPKYLSTGDLNNDGWPDFAVSSSTDQVFVHYNNKDGTLTNGVAVDVSASSIYTHIADVNGDGRNDILVSQSGLNTGGISVILQDVDDGTFCPAVNYLSLGDGRNIVTGDFDKDPDGNIDIIIAINDSGNRKLLLLINQGDGTFLQGGSISSGIMTGLDTADINNDGYLDLLTTISSPAKVIVNHGTGTSPFFGPGAEYPVHNNPYQGRFIDVNGDGILDILVGGAGTIPDDLGPDDVPPISDNITFIPGIQSGGVALGAFDLSAKVSNMTGQYKSRGFVAADFNNDGVVDFAASSQGKDKPPPRPGQDVRVLIGDNSGSFDVSTMQIYDHYRYARGIVSADIDKDGDLDIVFAIGANNSIGVLENTLYN